MNRKLLQQLTHHFRRWNHRRGTIRALKGLPDWQLRDIGLTRGEITAVVDAALSVNTPRAAAQRTQRRAGPASSPTSRPGGTAVAT